MSNEDFPKDLWLEIPASLRGEREDWVYSPSAATWYHNEQTCCRIYPPRNAWTICSGHTLSNEIDGIPVRIGQWNRVGFYSLEPILKPHDEDPDWRGNVIAAHWPDEADDCLDYVCDLDGNPLLNG